MDSDSYNNEILKVWNEFYDSDVDVRTPMLYPSMKGQAVVFVGFNPSFSERGWRHLSNHWPDPDLDPNEFFAWSNREVLDVAMAGRLERIAKEHYAYFKPMRSFAGAVDVAWEHVDIFAHRHKNQARVADLVVSDRSRLSLTAIGRRQMNLFEELIESGAPQAVVVANALGSQVYKQHRTPEFDVSSGVYWDVIGGARVPVFFSGMLTGQRALDRDSRDRLFWQLARALGRDWKPTA